MVSEAEVREIVLVVVVGPSLPKVAGVNEAKTVELLTILRPGIYSVKIRLIWITLDQIRPCLIMFDQIPSNLTVFNQMGHFRLNWIILDQIESYWIIFNQIGSYLNIFENI